MPESIAKASLIGNAVDYLMFQFLKQTGTVADSGGHYAAVVTTATGSTTFKANVRPRIITMNHHFLAINQKGKGMADHCKWGLWSMANCNA